jgi:hypothetical protein
MEDISGVTVPSKEVPGASLGEDLEMGMMRCGNCHSPSRLAGHSGAFGGVGFGGLGFGHSGAHADACRVISLGFPEAHWLDVGGVA